MPIKNLLYRLQPAPLYIVLILSICYFSVQLILSHLTHALTLLMASYHMLCNIFALAGSIITIKHNELHNENELKYSSPNLKVATTLEDNTNKQIVPYDTSKSEHHSTVVVQHAADAASAESKRRELKTHNTFGWARIEILTMLIVCITLASLSFSLLVEALQTLVHIDHQDSMHLPVHVMILGLVGLLLNAFTYFLIGGYTLHQGSFLHIDPKNGQVIVEPSNVSKDEMTLTVGKQQSTSNNDHQLKEDLKSELGKVHYHTRRQGPSEVLRDVSSTIFVIVCAIIVHFAEDKEHTAKFIDPVLSIFSCVLLVALSYPYMKEACLILLQTIPGSIDMENFERTLITKFPQIVSYHDLHIWQLSSQKYIATVHIIFQSPKLYSKTIDDVRSYFNDHSIAHVTIQPEFHDQKTPTSTATSSMECLMQCTREDCLDKVCCKDSMTDLREISVCPGGNGHAHEHDKKSKGGKSKKHNHGHSHDHGHGHSHKHSHDGYKYNHKHSHNKHNNSKDDHCNSKETIEVPKEIEEEKSTQQNETPKVEVTKKNGAAPSDTTTAAPSPIPAEVEVNCTVAVEIPNHITKPVEKTETSDPSQTKTSNLSTAEESKEPVDDEQQSSSDNTKC